ncbi:MAG: helix-turn-helix transcriptional regulator [Novosphingobium sp. 17-62-19]|uniref:helix-turn-helix transcriptional regulator n=1 Tax=Novosphingobium sp. 17-62-19 TaxID=1970406 RepID=UPI000BD1C8F7|nr:helix-turn-helix transcriptional regulator [Novosphingobium sp. 17-62-19]OZA17395.1 MAG: helix-turn-helix transcriptional regulator [Novosphingobium sp. 17-62-19]HQS97482.1 helix-turn-helix transcriptional regulator [Novosphingobium sp.]
MTVVGELFDNPLVELTSKQREVLDLLIQHKTSKEISRTLGISPHTVDQRIMFARSKLGVATRGEVAQAYRRLVEVYEQPVYEHSHVGFPPLPGAIPAQENAVDDASPAEFPVRVATPGIEFGNNAGPLSPLSATVRDDEVVYHRVLPEMFEGPNGTLMRLGFIGGLTVFMILILLGGLSMYAQLSTLLDR